MGLRTDESQRVFSLPKNPPKLAEVKPAGSNQSVDNFMADYMAKETNGSRDAKPVSVHSNKPYSSMTSKQKSRKNTMVVNTPKQDQVSEDPGERAINHMNMAYKLDDSIVIVE